MKKFLVTGTAGFIGYHLAKRLLDDGNDVVGVDIVNDYYDVRVKEKRNEDLLSYDNYKFYKINIADFKAMEEMAKVEKPEIIVHLAAQAGVRYSVENPWAYAESNYIGTLNVFEVARRFDVERVLFASTSSIYGDNPKQPSSEDDRTDTQLSFYAATKKANEVLAHSYKHMYGIKSAGLRFFTVYGRLGRPDLALFKFAKNILAGKEIDVYNNGDMMRQFTHVSDIVEGIVGIINKEDLVYELYNLGGRDEVKLMRFVELIEENLGIKAKINFKPMMKGDVKGNAADLSKAFEHVGYSPKVSIEDGIKDFCEWFVENKEWLLELEDGKQ